MRLLAAPLALTAAGLAVPGAPPAPLDTAVSAAGLPARYAAVRAEIAATGDPAFSRFLAGGRTFLAFDARGGRAVEVLGDLARADRIAVLVPGADGSLAHFDGAVWVGGGARALAAEARRTAPGVRLAVVAWLGYDAPSTRSPAVLTAGRARDGARALADLVGGLRRVNARATVALLCHSYGSVVCGIAGPRLGGSVTDIALYGSPGTTRADAADVSATARVWAARSRGDWTRYVPHVRVAGLGFGRDPVSPAFGARPFDAGAGAHGAYLRPGTTALRSLTRIALGTAS